MAAGPDPERPIPDVMHSTRSGSCEAETEWSTVATTPAANTEHHPTSQS